MDWIIQHEPPDDPRGKHSYSGSDCKILVPLYSGRAGFYRSRSHREIRNCVKEAPARTMRIQHFTPETKPAGDGGSSRNPNLPVRFSVDDDPPGRLPCTSACYPATIRIIVARCVLKQRKHVSKTFPNISKPANFMRKRVTVPIQAAEFQSTTCTKSYYRVVLCKSKCEGSSYLTNLSHLHTTQIPP